MATIPDPVPRPLKEMAPHISFEVKRLHFTLEPSNFHAPGELGGAVRESFLIHFRNLIDFLYGKAKYKTDVIASHYVEDWNPEVPAWVDEYRLRCHKLLAHLTYDRVEYANDKRLTWNDLETKARDLTLHWADFLMDLAPERRAWFS